MGFWWDFDSYSKFLEKPDQRKFDKFRYPQLSSSRHDHAFVSNGDSGTPILGNLQGESNVPRGICGTSGVDTDVDFDWWFRWWWWWLLLLFIIIYIIIINYYLLSFVIIIY